MSVSRVAADLLDLVLPRECAGCGSPGRVLCEPCRAAFAAELIFPSVPPVGALPVSAAARYGGLTRSLLLAHKERGQPTLARPLGRALAGAVRRLPGIWGPPAQVWLIPVPSGRGVDRARGSRPVLETVRAAAVELRSVGWRVGVSQPVVAVGRRLDQVGLSDDERWRNLVGSMTARRSGLPIGMPIVLVDDVTTSGATLTELDRTLRAVGCTPHGAAVIASATNQPRAREVLRRTSVGLDRSIGRPDHGPAAAPREELL